jgi:hypothetical protein
LAAPSPSSTGEQATIGKGLFIKGEITGSESLFHRRQGRGQHQPARQPRHRGPQRPGGRQHHCPRNRRAGQGARQRHATDRVDIRAEGSLSGDVAAARISIEDGAFFKGGIKQARGIDIRKPEGASASAGALFLVGVQK